MWTPEQRPSAVENETELNPSIFAHIHLDHRLEGSHLQGQTFFATTNYVQKMLKYIQQHECGIAVDTRKKIAETLKTVEDEFAGLIAIDQAVEKAVEDLEKVHSRASSSGVYCSMGDVNNQLHGIADIAIKKLMESGNVLIPGGWSGTSGKTGHMMCYQLKRKEDGSYQFLIFNTGAGINFHLQNSKFKDKFRPIKAYDLPKEITPEDFKAFIANRVAGLVKPRLYGIHEYRNERDEWNKIKEYDANRLYGETSFDVAVLGGKEINPKAFTGITTQGQFSGTCAMRVLMPLLHTRMGGEAFQQFLYQFRLQSILDHYRIQKKLDNLDKPIVARQLIAAIEKFIRTTRNLMERTKNSLPVLQKKQTEEVFASLLAIKKELEQIQLDKTSQAPERKQKDEKETADKLMRYDDLFLKYLRNIEKSVSTEPKKTLDEPQKTKTLVPMPALKDFNDPNEFLKISLKYLLENQTVNPASVISDIETLFNSMPLGIKACEEYWAQLKPELAEEALTTLQKIIRLYGKSCSREKELSNPFPRQMMTMTIAMTMASFASNRHFSGSVEKFKQGHFSRKLPTIPLFEGIKAVSLDPKWDQRLSDLQLLLADLRKKENQAIDDYGNHEEYEQLILESESLKEKTTKEKSTYFSRSQYDDKKLRNKEQRVELYKFLRGEIRRNQLTYPELNDKTIKDYEIMLAFDELCQEAVLLRDNPKYFDKFTQDLTPNAVERKMRLSYSINREKSYNDPERFNLHKDSVSNTKDKIDWDIQDKVVEKNLFHGYQYENDQMVIFLDYGHINPLFPLRKFVQIRLLQNEGRVVLTKDFYESNLELLNQKDHQTEFMANMFTPELLKAQLNRTPAFADTLVNFLKKGFKFHIENERLSNGGVFLFYFSSILLKYLDSMPDKQKYKEAISWLKGLDTFLLESIEHYRKLLKTNVPGKKELNDTLGQLLSVAVIRQSHSKEDKLSSEQLKVLLQGLLFKNMILPKPSLTPYFYRDLFYCHEERARILSKFEGLSKEIQEKTIREALNELLVPQHLPDSKYEIEINLPNMIVNHPNKKLNINFLKGTIESYSYREGYLPEQVYDDTFVKLFGKKKIAAKIQETEDCLRCEFQYKNHTIRLEHPKIPYKKKVIQMLQADKQWYELLDENLNDSPWRVLPMNPGHHHFDQDKFWWRAIDPKYSKTYYCTDNQLNYHLKIAMPNTKEAEELLNPKLTRSRDGWSEYYSDPVFSTQCHLLNPNGVPMGYTLLNNEAKNCRPLFEYVARFESKNFIEIWQSEDLQKPLPYLIKLPRYGLEWEGQPTKEGKLEFIWTQNKDYKLITESSSVAGISNCLIMENIKTKEKMVLLPKQEFYTDTEKEKEGEYYKLILDLDNMIPPAWLDNHKLSNYRWSNVGSQSYCQFKIKKKLLSTSPKELSQEALVAISSIDSIQLAYMYIAQHEPAKAMDALRQCREKGGIKGTFDELRILSNIINNIPNREINPLFHEKAKTYEPDTLALRLYASLLLAEQKQHSFNKPMFEKPDDSKIQSGNEAYNKGLKNEMLEFYQNKFDATVTILLKQYQQKFGNVSIENRLEPEDEYTLIHHLFKGSEPIDITLGNRKRELNLVLLSDQKAKLLKKQGNGSQFSLEDEVELKEVRENIKQDNQRMGSREILKTQQIAVIPSYPQLSSYELSFICPYPGSKKPPLTIDQITPTLFISSEAFLSAFGQLYEIATLKTMKTDEPKALASIELQQNIRSKLQLLINQSLQGGTLASKMNEKQPIFKLCSLLAYVLDNPGEKWPVIGFIPESKGLTFHEGLPKLADQCKAIALKKPIMVSVREKSQKTSVPVEMIKISDHRETITLDIDTLKTNTHKTPSLLQELEVDDLKKELELMKISSFTTSPISRKSPLKEVKMTKEEAFLNIMNAEFAADLEKGMEQNQARKLLQASYYKVLSDRNRQKSLFERLEQISTQQGKSLEQDKNVLLLLANESISGKNATTETRLDLAGKRISEISFEQLIWLYLQNDPNLYQEKTRLDPKSIHALHIQIHHYLLKATHNQHQKRSLLALEKLSKAKESSPEFEAALTELGDQLAATPNYDPVEQPEFLVFEYLDDKLLRPDQVKNLELLLKKEGPGFSNEVIQLIMGGGKSKVLLPLLSLKKAKGNNLSIIEVPASLFETNKVDMRSTTMSLFGIDGFPLSFDRDTDCSSNHLKLLLHKLRTVIKNRQYVITTSESVQSLQLKYLELTGNIQPNQEIQQQILLLEKILVMIKEKGDALIDECDTVLDPKRELNYTQGEPKVVPREILVQAQLIHRLFDKVKVPLASGDTSLRAVELGKSTITNDKDWDLAFNNLCLILMEDPEGPLYEITRTLSQEQAKDLKNYLLNELPTPPEFIQAHFKTKKQQQLLGLIKGELELFKNTLKKKNKEHFGLPLSKTFKGSKDVAIPYLASNTPNERAEFGSVLEIINYTLQSQKQKDPLAKRLILMLIESFKTRAREEMAKKMREPFGTISFKFDDTKAAKEFHELTGLLLSELLLSDKKALRAAQLKISQQPKARDYIVLNFVLTQIKQYPKILRSNAINHVSQYRSAQGITGTPWNAGCFHHKIHFDKQESLGTDGRTIDLLLEKDPKVYSAQTNTPAALIDDFIVKSHDTHQIHALIDVGALFKGYKNEKIAQQLALALSSRPENKIRHILYFNEDNELCALLFSRSADKKINEVVFKPPIVIGSTDPKIIAEKAGSPAECFTFYDQRHTTGTDIKQTFDTIGIMTMDIDTRLRDVLQGAMRLRELAGKQTLKIVAPKAISEVKNIHEILELTKQNQHNTLAELHLRSALDNIDNITRDYLLEKIQKAKTIEEKLKLRRLFSAAFLTKTKENMFKKYGECEQIALTETILNEAIEDSTNRLKKMLDKAHLIYPEEDSNKIKAANEKIKQIALKRCLVQYKHVPNKEEGSEVEAQKEKQAKKTKDKKKEMDRRFEREMQPNVTVQATQYIPWNDQFPLINDKESPVDIQSLNAMLQYNNRLVHWRFDSNILVTKNFIDTVGVHSEIMGHYLKPVNFFILMKLPNSDQLKAIIISNDEYAELLEYYDKNKDSLLKSGYELWFKTSHNTRSEGSSAPIENTQSQIILEQIRFFNGDLDQLIEDEKFIWCLEDMDQKLEILKNVILANQPEQWKYYDHFEQLLIDKKKKGLEASKVKFEALAQSILKNDVEQLNMQLIELKHEAIWTQKSLLNEKHKPHDVTLLNLAIKQGSRPIVDRLLKEELLLHALPAIEDSPLLLAIDSKNKNIILDIMEDKRIYPENVYSNYNIEYWSKLFNATFKTNDSIMLVTLIAEMKRYCNNDIIKKLLEDLFNEYSNREFKSIDGMLERMMNIFKWEPQIWFNFFRHLSIKGTPQVIIGLIKHWQNKPNHPLFPYLKSLDFYDDPDFILNPELALALLAESSLVIEPSPSRFQGLSKILALNTLNTHQAIFHIFKTLGSKERSELLMHSWIKPYIQKMINEADTTQEAKEKFITLLKIYPEKEDLKIFEEIFKSSYRTQDKVFFERILSTLNERSFELKELYLSFIPKYIPELLKEEKLKEAFDLLSFLDLKASSHLELPVLLQEKAMGYIGDWDLVKKLMPLINFKDDKNISHGTKLIEKAIKREQWDFVPILLNDGLFPNDPQALNLLVNWALTNKNTSLIIQWLEANKFTPNHNIQNTTLLLKAVEHKNLTLIEYLIKAGSEFKTKKWIETGNLLIESLEDDSLELTKGILKLLGDTHTSELIRDPENNKVRSDFNNYIYKAKDENRLSTLIALCKVGLIADYELIEKLSSMLEKLKDEDIEMFKIALKHIPEYSFPTKTLHEVFVQATKEKDEPKIKRLMTALQGFYEPDIVTLMEQPLLNEYDVDAFKCWLAISPAHAKIISEETILNSFHNAVVTRRVDDLNLFAKLWPDIMDKFLASGSEDLLSKAMYYDENKKTPMAIHLIKLGVIPTMKHLNDAIRDDFNDMLAVILSLNKINLNAPDSDNTTPLQCAIKLGKTEAVKLLLQSKADPNYIPKPLSTPSKPTANIAYKSSYIPPKEDEFVIFDEPISNSEEPKSTQEAPKKEPDIDIFDGFGYREEDFITLPATDEPKETAEDKAKRKASIAEHESALAKLMKKYYQMSSKEGDTLLMKAIRDKNFEIVKLLVESGASLTAVNSINENALAVAEIMEIPEMIEYLRKRMESKTDESDHIKNAEPLIFSDLKKDQDKPDLSKDKKPPESPRKS